MPASINMAQHVLLEIHFLRKSGVKILFDVESNLTIFKKKVKIKQLKENETFV